MAKQDDVFDLVERWRDSGMSRAAFARSEGISPNTFYYWLRRFEQDDQDQPASLFVEFEETSGQSRSGTPRLRLEYPDGVVISVY